MNEKRINILVLDGGGSKGVYTIGVLKELEASLDVPLYEHFGLIYGTSTGSIIAALIALGYKMSKIEEFYKDIIPKVMNKNCRKSRSNALKNEAKKLLGEKKFDEFKTNVGIVALNFNTQEPLIFKTSELLAHGNTSNFAAGFNCTIEEALRCSSAAYPFFQKINIHTKLHGNVEVVDGGFIANNPTLYAIIDAHKALKFQESEINLLNVGVGSYIEKVSGIKHRFFRLFSQYKFVEKVLTSSTKNNTVIAKLIFKDLNILRISNEYLDNPEYETNMLESKPEKLEQMIALGISSYEQHEKKVKALFSLK